MDSEDFVDQAITHLNSDNLHKAYECAKEAVRLYPTSRNALDVLGVSSAHLANYFSGTAQHQGYYEEAIAAFKEAARLGSPSAIRQLEHLNISL